ncbi:MAG: DNA adenine methylase [Candidatus Anammoxibacter sp.]
MQLSNQNKSELEPFLKWAGGKRWLVKRENQIAPPSYKRYIEPFLGGAAVFFSLPEIPYIISDLNPELVNCYNAIKADFREVEKHLRSHQRKHCDDYYYQVRKSQPRKECIKAARFLYLNRTCWNGLYRVNLQGKFNVPRGTKNKVLLDADNFENVAKRLSKGEILCQDFEKTLSLSGEGDFVFIDPPYTVNHNLNGFLKYNEKIFSWADQERLVVDSKIVAS